MHTLVDVDAIDVPTSLTAGTDLALDHKDGSPFQVRIGHYDGWRIAPQFQGEAFDGRGRLSQNLTTGFG